MNVLVKIDIKVVSLLVKVDVKMMSLLVKIAIKVLNLLVQTDIDVAAVAAIMMIVWVRMISAIVHA